MYSEEQRPLEQTGTSSVLGDDQVHSVEKTHVLVVTVELIWMLFLNILSSNFIQTPNKSRKFRRFRTIYVHRSTVVPTKFALIFFA